MRILAVCIAFNPDPALMLRSVMSYAPQVDKLLVWRNSPLPQDLVDSLGSIPNLEFRGDCTNAGISAALNAAWREAAAGAYDYLLTMDQDSVWHGFDAFVRQVSGLHILDSFYTPLILMMGESPAPGNGAMCEPVDFSMTSGMLLPIDVIEKVGGWDESLEVDAIDTEFCLHARSLGLQCYRCGSGWIEHSLGKRRRSSFLGLKFYTYNYSPQRLYGIYKNHFIVFRRYPQVCAPARKAFLRTWGRRRPVRILLGESDKVRKFRAILKGIRDGLKG